MERDGYNIFSTNLDGSALTPLTTGIDPVWSPDGRKIAFVRHTGRTPSEGEDGRATEIYVMNFDGSGVTALTSHLEDDYHPTWSPDGKKIAFASEREGGNGRPDIYVMNADGSDIRRIAPTSRSRDEPAWSPDGTRIAFTAYRANSDIFVINVDGSGETPLTTTTASRLNSDPQWSPDGKKIAFTSGLILAPDETDYDIYAMNADGSDQRPVLAGAVDDFFGNWSPDGSKIVFASYRPSDP
ncbi:MAG TPA: hypothetical protein VNI55_06920, partial [Gaiellaceae bacterium]|nr:hypothetical protein [Gaiellaceae bacterium]